MVDTIFLFSWTGQ